MFRKPDSPTRFSIAELADLTRGATRAVTLRGSDNLDSNYLSTSSFAYDPYESGLKSTQQLKVDWTKFENHTFFNSATAKVNVAFERIVNGYPFDGSKKDLERYLDGLTGFEKWVLDSFPRNIGYLNFENSYLSIADHQGGIFPELAKNKSGDSVLDPKTDPYTVEFYLYLPPAPAGSQVIFQKQTSDNVGVTAYIKSGSSAATAEVAWAMYSGSSNMVVSASVARGQFLHIANVYDRDDSGRAKLYIDGELKTTSSNVYQFDSILTNNAAVTIGSGSAFMVQASTVTPDMTLSASLDELRVFREARNQQQIKKFINRNVYAQDNLILYYKFNEPTGSLSGDETSAVNSIVLDSSGNGMHAYINGFSFSQRSTGSLTSPLTLERADLNPVVFPGFADVQTLNTELLASASLYDQDNPNLITRLVPKHYLTDGQDFEGLLTETGAIDDNFEGSSIPGTGKLGSTQLFLALLYTWAKYFDELKLFVDAFSKIHYVDYDEKDTSPDVFLPFALREFGIKMPNLFSDAAFSQYKDGEDVDPSYSLNDHSLLNVQNQIMRRVLTNMSEIIRSKGTLHSIEAFFRSIGIDPHNSFKIKEKGGPTMRSLDVSREVRIEPMTFLSFENGGLVQSSFLSGSRAEVGSPQPVGTFVQKDTTPPHGVSDQRSDGLWTSGSWTYEAVYRWPPKAHGRAEVQSLARMYTSASTGASERLLVNLLAVSGSDTRDPMVVLYARPGTASSLDDAPLLSMTASMDIFDGDPWYVSFGKVRNDLTGSGIVSSSYFLRVARQNMGTITDAFASKSLFNEAPNGSTSALMSSSLVNELGPYIKVGSSTEAGSGVQFLNSTASLPSDVLNGNFDGQLSRMRFWSKGLDDREWEEHARNPHSAGVRDPNVNFNFSQHLSGAFERMRVDVTCQQEMSGSTAAGSIWMFDYSQNLQHLSGSGFPASTKVLLPKMVGYSYISPEIDEAVSSDKVRVRSYQDYAKVKRTPWAAVAPVHEVPKNEEPQDDPRLSIEFSLVDALNRDIVTMFATMEQLDTALGAPENEFSSQYQNLEHLKEVYFNRLMGKLNFRAFFDFFRWFDSSVAYFVEHLIPRKTVYYGTNFVIESHLLERHKKQYFHYDMYLSEENKPLIEDRILLQQLAGVVRKF
jgi:hypothetical protein